MSTECTYDLTPLKRIKAGESFIFKSEYSSSTYSSDGEVLSGPSESNLPFYRLVLDASKIGGKLDTLYAVIGDEVSSSWRLNNPAPRKGDFFSDLLKNRENH